CSGSRRRKPFNAPSNAGAARRRANTVARNGGSNPVNVVCLVRTCSKSRELEQCKAKTGKEAEFTSVNEHSEPVFNAAVPTRSRLWIGSDRKSTRLNSSHVKISYAVFCLKKKTK